MPRIKCTSMGTKHSQVYRIRAPVYLNWTSFGQMHKSSSKVLFKFEIFHGVLDRCVGTHIQNIKMRSSELLIKITSQKVIAKFGFGCRFHGLEYFEVGFSLGHIPWICYKLEGITTKICRKTSI